VRIRDAKWPDDLVIVRSLFEDYVAEIGVDLSFQGFAAEVADLPGKYVEPRGGLWLAEASERVVGCIALRSLSDEVAEMKRLFVASSFRSQGVGRALIEHAVMAATRMNFREVCLDTLAGMHSALRLYKSLRFEETEPYYSNPIPGAIFLMRLLAEQSNAADSR
jgi:putative acetyltransferase